MTAEETIEVVKTLAGLFPNQVTTEQAKQLKSELRAFSKAAAMSAVREHRKNPDLAGGFWNMGKLLEGCRAAERGESLEAKQFSGNESLPDIIRRGWEQLRDRNDYEVLLRYWRADWHRYSTDADRRKPTDESTPELKAVADQWRQQFDGARRRVEAGCRGSLISAGMEAEVVDGWAASVFDPDPAFFRQCLEVVRQMTPPAQAEKNREQTPQLAF